MARHREAEEVVVATWEPTGPQELGNVRWDGFSHRHLWNMIMDARPDDVFDRYDRWTRLGEELKTVNTAVQQQLNSLFGTWQGAAAMGAGQANTRLLQWSQDAAETTQRVGEELGNYGNALVEARKRMPQPRAMDAEQDFRAGEGTSGWTGPENAYLWLQLMSDHQATARERTEAREGAIEVMRTFEAAAVRVDREVAGQPVYDTPPPAVDTGNVYVMPTPTPGPGDNGIVVSPPGQYEAPVTTGTAGHQGGPGGGPGGTGGPGGAYGPGAGPGGGPGGSGGYGPGVGGRFGVPGGPGGAGAGAGRFGAGGHVPGGGAGGVGAGAAGRGVGYGALPGGSAAAAEAAAARAAGAGGAGAAGRGAGMGGMYPPVGGGMSSGDDDTEKRVAPYLVDADDLFDDDRTVAPPVFGA
jgi:hypothetical protein